MKLLTQWAITSGALILIVLAVRALFKNELSARLRYALWAVVLVRLLVPFQVTLPAAASDPLPLLASNFTPEVADVELYALRTSSRPISKDDLQSLRDAGREPGDVLAYETNIHHFGDLEVEGSTHCYVLSDTSVDLYFFYTTLPKFLLMLWAAGAVLTAWTIFRSNRYFWGRLKYYRHPVEAEAPIPVYRAAHLVSPCLFGVLRPAVYVTPDVAEDPDVLRHVLAHELTHYSHKDHIWSLLRCLALALHWYNPLVWLAVGLSKGDGELACDEGAVALLGEAERIPYGRTLVDMVAARSLRPMDLLSCSTAMTGGKKSIQQRVALLVKKPETVKVSLFLTVSVLVLAAVFVFAQRGADDTSNQFLTYLDRAVSIRCTPQIFSSEFYPAPITDEDLLTAAKERLSTFTYLDEGDPGPDLQKGMFNCYRFTLQYEINGQFYEPDYTLIWENNYTYLIPGNLWEMQSDLEKEEGETAQLLGVSGTMRSRPNDHVGNILVGLARQQNYRFQEDATPATYDYNMYHNRLAAAQGFYRSGTMLHNGQSITAQVLLAQARELLTLDPIPRGGPLEWDGDPADWSGSLVISTQSPGLSWGFNEWMENGNVFSIVTPEESTTAYICTGSNGTGGYYLGTISYDDLDALNALFDRQDQLDADWLYSCFLREVRTAVSVQVETGDGTKLPPITDPEYLEQARTALLTTETPEAPSVGGPILRSEDYLRYEAASGLYAVTLTLEDSAVVTYYLDNSTNCILIPLGDFPLEDTKESCVFGFAGILPSEANYALWVYANAASGRIDPPTGHAVPDLSGLTIH